MMWLLFAVLVSSTSQYGSTGKTVELWPFTSCSEIFVKELCRGYDIEEGEFKSAGAFALCLWNSVTEKCDAATLEEGKTHVSRDAICRQYSWQGGCEHDARCQWSKKGKKHVCVGQKVPKHSLDFSHVHDDVYPNYPAILLKTKTETDEEAAADVAHPHVPVVHDCRSQLSYHTCYGFSMSGGLCVWDISDFECAEIEEWEEDSENICKQYSDRNCGGDLRCYHDPREGVCDGKKFVTVPFAKRNDPVYPPYDPRIVRAPTREELASGAPSATPTTPPTRKPTRSPTDSPTADPTVSAPTQDPTKAPSPKPTESPTPQPTKAPTPGPTRVSTPSPTETTVRPPAPPAPAVSAIQGLVDRHMAQDVCTAENDKLQIDHDQQWLREANFASARCCSNDGTRCVSMFPVVGCSGSKTYEEAEEFCTTQGYRLCTSAEITSNLCCDTGCDDDNKLVWTSDSRCFDDLSTSDVDNLDCNHYYSYPDECGLYNNDNFNAEKMCCACTAESLAARLPLPRLQRSAPRPVHKAEHKHINRWALAIFGLSIVFMLVIMVVGSQNKRSQELDQMRMEELLDENSKEVFDYTNYSSYSLKDMPRE